MKEISVYMAYLTVELPKLRNNVRKTTSKQHWVNPLRSYIMNTNTEKIFPLTMGMSKSVHKIITKPKTN